MAKNFKTMDCPRCFVTRGSTNTANQTLASIMMPSLFPEQYRCGCGCVFTLKRGVNTKKYAILRQTSRQELEDEVTRYLAYGYTLAGGVVIDGDFYLQAVAKQ